MNEPLHTCQGSTPSSESSWRDDLRLLTSSCRHCVPDKELGQHHQGSLLAKGPVARAQGPSEPLRKLAWPPQAPSSRRPAGKARWHRGCPGTGTASLCSRSPLGSPCLMTGLIPEQNR